MLNIYKRVETWSKEHPFFLLLLSYPVVELIKFIHDTIKGVDYSSLLGYLVIFLNIDFNVKAWHILLLSIFLFLFIYIRSKRSKSKTGMIRGSANTHVKSIAGSAIHVAKHPYNASLTSEILKNENGIFSIWGFVSSIHNEIQRRQRFKYVVGYATNNGNTTSNPSFATYPNAWAIQRITPTQSDHFGTWRFWCNNIEKPSTQLDFKQPLSGGWHLFSVAWSLNGNYIKFIIDESIAAESKFANWPSDFSSSIRIGTWPTMTPDHYFDSKVGPYRFTPCSYDKEVITGFFKEKPEKLN